MSSRSAMITGMSGPPSPRDRDIGLIAPRDAGVSIPGVHLYADFLMGRIQWVGLQVVSLRMVFFRTEAAVRQLI